MTVTRVTATGSQYIGHAVLNLLQRLEAEDGRRPKVIATIPYMLYIFGTSPQRYEVREVDLILVRRYSQKGRAFTDAHN